MLSCLCGGQILIVNEFTAEKWIYGGDALGRVEGRVVLAPFLLPGETARVEVESEKRDLLRARVTGIASPSAERIEPKCPYFARCGGCHYQHAGYEYQLEQKKAILREVLRRVGKLEAPEEIETLSAEPWEYRNRSQFHLAGGQIGYLEAGSHRLCPVESCPISSPRINEALGALREMMRERRFPHFVDAIELFTNETDVQVNVLQTRDRRVGRSFFDWCAEKIPGAGATTLDYPAGGDVFRVSPRSFFQVNRFLAGELPRTTLEGAEGESAVDLYAGAGLFSIPLARRFRSVTAVESGLSAYRDLEFNAGRAGVSLQASRTTAELFLEKLERAPDFILADPPRAGLGKQAVRELVRLRAPRLTIVSCEPSTLARDLAPLLAAGYRMQRLMMADLFPQTYHIESVVDLRL